MSRNYVLKISVGKGLEVHEASDKSVYVRKGAQSLIVRGAAKLMELAYAKGKISAEDNDVENARIEDIEKSSALTSYIAQLPITDKDPLNFLLQENLFNPETWIPKTSSVLLSPKTPQR